MRQARYALDDEHCIDWLLSMNGLSEAAADLSTDFTHGVGDASDRYRLDCHGLRVQPDRQSDPGVNPALSHSVGCSPLFEFPERRCLSTERDL